MSNPSSDPISDYLDELARGLDLPRQARDGVLEELRAHLEEQAAALQAGIADPEAAQTAAVRAFGNARVVARDLSRAYAMRWGPWRFARAVGLGIVATWVIWTLGTFPVLASYAAANAWRASPPPYVSGWDAVQSVLIQSTPLTSSASFAYYSAGWLWLVPLGLIWLALPFTWALRTRRWWLPGLSYGLGGWIAVPWFVRYIIPPASLIGDWPVLDASRLVLVMLPCALLASFVAYVWQERRRPAHVTGLLAV